ncbi:MAG: hypothetical protein GXP27_15940 [Planctomycetes bacterium]|nr:hypothetical protein [Planctomycetota bacterium]
MTKSRRTTTCLLGAWLVTLAVSLRPAGGAEPTWEFKKEFWPILVRAVPGILKSQDPKTGRFGSGIWIVNDQNVLFPLAVAWAVRHPDNPYYHDEELLEAIMAGGDALIDDQDERGMWVFRKKDGSTWGKTYMPWTYSRWVRAFSLVRDAMPPERRERWEKALTLGYEGIARSALHRVHNIPAHHAMGLYCAGQVLNRPQWCEQAKRFMAKVCAAQNPGGYWSEHIGPVVAYNFVYTEALGVYHAMSGDEAVLPALRRAAVYHAAFTYPDGSRVETIDERNPYDPGVVLGTVGFTFSPEGRGFVRRQWERMKAAAAAEDADRAPLIHGPAPSADTCATFILYGQEGPCASPPGADGKFHFVLGENDAVVHRAGPWFVCLSAFHSPVLRSRWIQDRQNFVSLFHDRTGLIVGGGNTKLQPLWSTFTVGDVSLLKHRPGDTRPNFIPPEGLQHVPSQAALDPDGLSLVLSYGPETCRVTVDVSHQDRAVLTYETTTQSGQPVEAHVTLLPHLDAPWRTESGRRGTLSGKPLRLTSEETGAWFAHSGWRISVPQGASIVWPALPHNPYRKDGRATPAEGRIVLVLPFDKTVHRHAVAVEVERPPQ